MSRSPRPEYTAWLLADMGTYAALAGHAEAGLTLARQACRVAEGCENAVEPYLRRWDYGSLLIDAGRPGEALRILPEPNDPDSSRARHLLVLTEAHLRAGNQSDAHDRLQQASDVIAAYDLARLRPRAEALAQRF